MSQSTIPDCRLPPMQPAAAIAQTRNWFLFRVNGEPMVYRRKAQWFIVPGENIRQFVGDDFEPHGHMMSAKPPDTVSEVFQKAWNERSNPPLLLSTPTERHGVHPGQQVLFSLTHPARAAAEEIEAHNQGHHHGR